MTLRLRDIGLTVNTQIPFPVIYKGIKLEIGFRIDILVENQIIVKIKSVETLYDVNKKQLLTYLRLSNKKSGILVNFNTARLLDKESIIRIIN